MRKLLMLLLLMVCFMGVVSAAEFDNVKNYNPETREVIVNNCDFWLGICLNEGDAIGGAQLNTPNHFFVKTGYTKVAEFDLWAYQDYNDIIKNIKVYDMNYDNWEEHELSKNIDMKYLSYENIEVEDYEYKIIDYFDNGTAIYEKVIIGTHLEEKEKWDKVTPAILMKNERVTVGLFTEVEEGDYVEWILNLYGVSITEWASYEAEVTDAHGNVQGNTGALSVGTGGAIVPQFDVLLTRVKTTAASNPTTASVFYGGNGSLLIENTSAVNDEWLFNTNLNGGDLYFIEVDSGGSSYTQTWKTAGAQSFPIVGTNIDYVWGTTTDGTANSTQVQTLESITTRKKIDDAPPLIALNLPLDNANYTDDPTIVNFSCNASDDINLTNVSLLLDGVINQTNTSGINNTQYNFEVALTEGGYDWTCEATDNSSTTTQATNRTFFIHDTPITLNVLHPDGEKFGLNTANDEIVLNWTISETGQNLTTHVVNCTYDYNGTVTEINNTVCTQLNETTFQYAPGVNTLIFNVTDEFGFVTSDVATWEVNLTEVSQVSPNSSVEGSTETYSANVVYDNSTFNVITASLHINGTTYLGTKTGNGNNASYSVDAIMPSISDPTNFTAYWTISLTDAGGTINYNLSSTNVTVDIINLTLCDAGNNVSFWNFTILNETNLAEINSTFEATFNVRRTGSTTNNYFNFSDITANNSQFDFCISPTEESYTIDTSIQLTKTGFVNKFYNYEDVVVTNSTREDNLYMMTNEDSTSFIVHVVYITAVNIDSAQVNVERYYPGEDQWLTTEILTTNDVGKAVGHMLAEDANYRFKVYKNGVSIHNSSSTQITCSVTPCTVQLVVPLSVLIGTETLDNLESALTYNSNVFTYTYSDSSGTFSEARLHVIRLAPSNATITIPCNITKSTATGVITCDITGQINGTYQASGYITRDVETLDKRINRALGTNIYDSMGEDGVLWSIFILIGIVALGMKRPSLAIVFGVVGFVALALMNIINIGAISIVSVIAIGIILLTRVGRE